tara:strand:- start:310 stop:519 length:210 start_codon:yes stop_codon:yes gene_type:complete
MPESITFTWSDVYSEARPSPTTKRRLEEWRQQSGGGLYKSDIYHLDFLSDVIGELTSIYNEMLTVKDEE